MTSFLTISREVRRSRFLSKVSNQPEPIPRALTFVMLCAPSLHLMSRFETNSFEPILCLWSIDELLQSKDLTNELGMIMSFRLVLDESLSHHSTLIERT